MAEHSQDTSTRKLQVFLCHASEDKSVVRDIYQKLKRYNIEPWLDEKNLLPGERWEQLIPPVIRKSDIILICLSRASLIKDGYVNYELHVILEAAKQKPPDTIYHIPFKLDDCEIPYLLEGIHYVSNFVPEDFAKLIAACEKRREWLTTKHGMHIEPVRDTVPEQTLDAYPISGNVSTTASLPHATTAKPSVARPAARFGAPFPEVWNVVRRHNPFFTGRLPVLEKLFDGFSVESEGGMIPPQAITALGGMGKTQTAAEYAYRFRENYQAVLWVRAETQEDLLTDFQTLAQLLKLPQESLLDQAGLMQTMQAWFSTQTDWLLILDNADNLALVDPFLPRAARGHILLTTRAGATTGQAQALRLGPLEPDDGALCILRRAGILEWNKPLQDAPGTSVDAARQLAQLMEGLPLALEQAGAYINDTESGVKRYLNLYKQYRIDIQHIHSGTVHDYPEAVASAWRISWTAVQQNNPAAAELLCLCAFLAPEAIPDEVLTVGASALGPVLGPIAASPVKLDQAIGFLRKYSLLSREVDRQADLTRLSIHRIIQEILLDEMDEPTQKLWAERAVRAIARSFPSLPWYLLQAHARNCLQFIKKWNMTFPEAERLRQWIETAPTQS
jgi:TIR domain/NB-ARC domain